jgi:hypothetical protein
MNTAVTIAPEHLAVPRNAILEMIVRASVRENHATSRLVIADAREQGEYWTAVLTDVLTCQGFTGARDYANWLIANHAHTVMEGR